MKVTELSGALLDYWVARAENLRVQMIDIGRDRGFRPHIFIDTANRKDIPRIYSPTLDWTEAGPIIERERIALWYTQGQWEASAGSPVHAIEISGPEGRGSTPLVAAMRAFVRQKFGKEVPENSA